MSRAREGVSRTAVTTMGLVLLVIASGFGGMLLAKHFHHGDAAPSTYPVVVPAAAASSPAEGSTPAANVGAGAATVPSDSAASQAQASTSAAPASPGSDTLPPPEGSPGAITEDQEIELALHRWQIALLANDGAQIGPSYSSKVKRYFLQQDVTRTYVEQYMIREEANGFRLRSYDLQKVSIEHVGRHAVDVHFVAHFTADTPGGTKSGSTRTLLKMHQEDGDWKIYFERDYSG